MEVKSLVAACLFLSIFHLGCSLKTQPQYALIEGESSAAAGEGLPVEGGWEFQFPRIYSIQKVTINYEGSLTQLTLHSRTDRGWEQIKSVDAQASSPLVMELNLNTSAVRLFPRFSGKGRIAFCQFHTGRKQRVFSVPLEKPPFIK